MRTLQTQAKRVPTRREVNTLPSQTVPDQTLSIRQILDRYAKGQPVSASTREPVYNEQIDFDSPNHYDLTEIDDIKAHYKEVQRTKEAEYKELTKPKPKPKAEENAEHSE